MLFFLEYVFSYILSNCLLIKGFFTIHLGLHFKNVQNNIDNHINVTQLFFLFLSW